MKKVEKSRLYVVIIVLIIIIAALIGIVINLLNVNNIINKQDESQTKQLTETTSSNAYVDMETHLSELNQSGGGTIKTVNLGESNDTQSWLWSGDDFVVNYSFATIANKCGLTAEEVENLIKSGKMIPYTSNFRGRSTTSSGKWMQYLNASTTSTGIKASIFCSGFSTKDEITFYFNTYVAWVD